MSRATGLVVMALASLSGAGTAQELALSTSMVEFRFSEPSRIGLESYLQRSTRIGLGLPLASWLGVGATVQHAAAEMSSPLEPNARLSGMTDAEAFTMVALGPLQVRGAYLFDSGEAPSSSSSLAVAGVAAYEFMPVPVRSWGRGGGHSLDARLVLGSSALELEMLAGVRSHGTLPRSDVQGIEYTFGGEKHIGLRTIFRNSALTRVEIGARATSTDSDRVVSFDPRRTEHPTVFAPGRRIGVHIVAAFPVRATSMLLFGDFSRRAPGSIAGEPVFDAFGRPVVDAPGRHVFSGALETRTPLRYLPLRLTLRARRISHEDDPGGGWLGTAGIGTDVRVFGPWPGILLLTPKASLHTGRIEVMEGYASDARGWGLSVSAEWRWR